MNASGAPPVGRFAPTPSGPLHFGSLLAALASYLQVRSLGGAWLVRIEDIDPPREKPGAADAILRALEAYGFEWDGQAFRQSGNNALHLALIERLTAQGHAYHCGCSRGELAGARRGPLGIVYPGTCRAGCSAEQWALRVRTDDRPVRFDDLFQGPQSRRLESESGDFVILRRDGLVAYQLAVVADDRAQGITQVVRGADLLESTARQIHLQRLLGYPTPVYGHIPLAVDARGRKLGKSTGAAPVPVDDVGPTLVAALAALGQAPPAGLEKAGLDAIWSYAREQWNPSALAQIGRTGPPGRAAGRGSR